MPGVRDLMKMLLAESERSVFRLRFSGPLEARYREDLRRHLRMTRVVLFLAIGLAFAIAPFQEVSLFNAPVQMRGSLLLFAQTLAPLCLMAAAFTYLRAMLLLTQALQVAAVFATLVAVLALRHVDLISEFRYPSGMLSLTAIAVAMFGGFMWRPLALGLVAFFAAAIAQEFAYTSPGSTPALEAYQLAFGGVIALACLINNEVLRRQNWLRKESATVQSRLDKLSGLSNRADFDRRIEATLRQARRDQRMVALMVLDVDHFKKINDRHGHATGDLALGAVAEAINRSCAQRPLDIKARTGGEEFIVVWYDVAIAAVPALVERVLAAVRAIRLEVPGVAEPLTLTASAGACWGVPQEAATPQALVDFADALMYKAKQAGRNQACVDRFRPGSPV